MMYLKKSNINYLQYSVSEMIQGYLEGILIIYLIIGIIFAVALSYFYYQRNLSIKNVPCIDVKHSKLDENRVVVDFRDYNNLADELVFNAIVIPIPYLKRYYQEIPSKQVHVIASNKLEKNIGVRFLQKHGFHVTGYSLAECTCQHHTDVVI